MGNWLKSFAWPAILTALLLSALPGCSMLRLGYGQLDTYAAWTAHDYFDLEPQQRQEFSRRFDRIHSWHRWRQREFLQLMSQRGDARQFTERLRYWLAHWEEGRDPEVEQLFRIWEQKQADLYVAVAEMLTPQQRASAVRRIQAYMDDFTQLAQRPDGRTSASR